MGAQTRIVDGGELALIEVIRQFKHGEEAELDRQRTVSGVGAKKAVAVDLDSDQAKAFKT